MYFVAFQPISNLGNMCVYTMWYVENDSYYKGLAAGTLK